MLLLVIYLANYQQVFFGESKNIICSESSILLFSRYSLRGCCETLATNVQPQFFTKVPHL